MCFFGGFYTESIGSFLPTFRENGGCEIPTAVLVKIQVITDVSPFRLVRLPSSSAPTVQDALHSTKSSVTLHQSTGRNLQHLCENVMYHIIERLPGQVTVYDASFTDLWRSLPHSQRPHTGHIFHSMHYDILNLVNTNKCTILKFVYSFYYM